MGKLINIQDLVTNNRTVTVSLPDSGGEIEVTYRPYNAEIEKRWMALEADPDLGRLAKLASQCSSIVTGWNVAQDGKPIEPTLEVLMQLDSRVVNAIFVAIIGDMLPPKASSETSEGGS